MTFGKCLAIFVLAAALPLTARADGQQTSSKPESTEGPALTKTLAAEETKLWDAWKNKQPDVWRENLADEAVFFGEYGVSSKAENVKGQEDSVKSCEVQSFTLTNFRVIALDENAAILLYEAEQHAVCGGQTVQPFMHGSSVYVRRNGRWLNIFRSEVPKKN